MTRRHGRAAAAFMALGLVAGLASCTSAPTIPSPGGVTASGSPASPGVVTSSGSPASPGSALQPGATRARTHMEALANGIGARYSGTPAEQSAGDYIKSAFTQMGYSVEQQAFQFGERGASIAQPGRHKAGGFHS